MKKCKSEEIALKSYFLGPQAENGEYFEAQVGAIVRDYLGWRKEQFPTDGDSVTPSDKINDQFLAQQKKMSQSIDVLLRRFREEIPQYSPRYMAHMFSEISVPGVLGHFLALLHNPNNISKESSKIGVFIETEAIASLCKMFGWQRGYGHFTSGGSIANLEALLRMRERISMHPNKANAVLLTTAAAHYSWHKAMGIIGLAASQLVLIPVDRRGRMNTKLLGLKIRSCLKDNIPILGVVSLFGSTELGSVDDIETIQNLIDKEDKNIWHHVDAAYGGYYAIAPHPKGSHLAVQSKALNRVTSLTLDPHKLGYVPYGCGAFLCRTQKFYTYAKTKVPYVQFDHKKDRGLQTIEGSRPATGPAGVWLIGKTLGYHADGLGKVLARHLAAQKKMRNYLKKNIKSCLEVPGLDLNIVCWTVVRKKLSQSNSIVDRIYKTAPTGSKPYFVAKTKLHLEDHPHLADLLREKGIEIDSPDLALVRMTLMNPFSMTRGSETQFLQEFVALLSGELKKIK